MGKKEDSIVRISALAYMKMLKHVLRFGSMGLKKSQYKECMGMLMGKNEGKSNLDVQIVDVVPITHGGKIEVEFSDQDYVSFSEVDGEYAEGGYFNVGWYHSHPGMTPFLSTVDVRNHLGFQTTNPAAIAIVWDHQLLEEEGHAGFEVFRLVELSKLQYSDYREVKYEVELPPKRQYYKWALTDVITRMKAGYPPMLEANEIPSILGNYLTSKPDAGDFSVQPTTLEGELLSEDHAEKRTHAAILEVLSKIAEQTAQILKNKNLVIANNLESLAQSLDENMNQFQTWFLTELNELLNEIYVFYDDPLELIQNATQGRVEKLKIGLTKLEEMGSESNTASEDESWKEKSLDELMQQLYAEKQKLQTALQSKGGEN